MPEAVQQYIVIGSLALLVFLLYRDIFRASILFLSVILIFLVTSILTPEDVLRGLANKQIIIIFLLVILTSGFRNVFGSDFFFRWFPITMTPRRFLLKLMLTVSSFSAFLNNTPIVAFMIPYVKEWTNRKQVAPSRFMIPLSYATILGGMITVVGTSTNLVLNGLIAGSHLPLLTFADFFYLGVLITIAGIAYLYLFGDRLLPERRNKLEDLNNNLQEYFVETIIPSGSALHGQNVRQAGLRNLKDIYLVELVRGDDVISPVAPEFVLKEKDILFFSGYIPAIAKLVKENKGISLSDEQELVKHGHFHCVEAVVPAHSSLAGVKVSESDFRKKFNASIVAIHRQGKRITDKIGNRVLVGGDLLFLLAGNAIKSDSSELLVLTNHDENIKKSRTPLRKTLAAAVGMLLLLGGIFGILDLFIAVTAAIIVYVFAKFLSFQDLKRAIDFDLVILLVASLGIGMALTKTGTAGHVTRIFLEHASGLSPIAVITILFLITLLLTSLITNAAAVAIVFPFAIALAEQKGIPARSLFVAIAFAASADFVTPIGYQTNLMVMGPGNYQFRDYARVGLPLTLLYALISLTFIYYYYNL